MAAPDAGPLALDDGTIDAFLASSRQPVLVDFWADWCGPCLLMAPALDHVAETFPDRLHVAKLDVEANAAASERFGVRSLPTLIVFEGAHEVARLVGLRGRAQLLADLAPWLDGPQGGVDAVSPAV